MKLINLSQIVNIDAEQSTVKFIFSDSSDITLVSNKYYCDNFVILESLMGFIKNTIGWIEYDHFIRQGSLDYMIEDSFLTFENRYKNEILEQFKIKK